MSGPSLLPRASPTRPSTSCSRSPTPSTRLVLYAAKRARQINAYYSQLGEGLLEYVGPLVETHVQEKPLSIAMREINSDLLTVEPIEPAELHRQRRGSRCRRLRSSRAAERETSEKASATGDNCARVLGVTGGIAAYKACELLRRSPRAGTPSASSPPPARCGSSARPPGRRCRVSPSPRMSGTTCTRCPTCASVERPTSSWSRPRLRICSPRPPVGSPTTC